MCGEGAWKALQGTFAGKVAVALPQCMIVLTQECWTLPSKAVHRPCAHGLKAHMLCLPLLLQLHACICDSHQALTFLWNLSPLCCFYTSPHSAIVMSFRGRSWRSVCMQTQAQGVHNLVQACIVHA